MRGRGGGEGTGKQRVESGHREGRRWEGRLKQQGRMRNEKKGVS